MLESVQMGRRDCVQELEEVLIEYVDVDELCLRVCQNMQEEMVKMNVSDFVTDKRGLTLG